MPLEALPGRLAHARSLLVQVHTLCENQGISPAGAALMFSLTTTPSTSIVVFGVHGMEQLLANVDASRLIHCFDPEPFCRAFNGAVDVAVVNPSLWSPR